MKKHNFFKNQKKELHLTNGIKTKIVDIAKIIKKNLSNKNLKIKIISGKSKDNVQLNKNNKNNNFLKKYWKPKVSISAGINKIISHYLED
jgi:nucleoside-diphosphate-sugar epimerase